MNGYRKGKKSHIAGAGSGFSSRTNQFFMFGLIAHVYILLFVSAYAYFIDASHHQYQHESSSTFKTQPPTERNHHIFSSLSGGVDGIGIESYMLHHDPKWIFNFFSIISIAFLYVSLSLKFTWPIRIEETLIIILLWMVVSNTFNNQPHCSASSASTSSVLEKEGEPPPGAAKEKVVNTDSSSLTFEADGGGGGGLCQWELFNLTFSLLCILTAVLSFLSDVKNYYLSVLFGGASFVLMMVIIFMPVSCNQFRFMDINILILKITLYNIIWNVNRFLRYTEIELEKEYNSAVYTLKQYKITSTYIEPKKGGKGKNRNRPPKKIITKEEYGVTANSPFDLMRAVSRIGHRLNKPDHIFQSDIDGSHTDNYDSEQTADEEMIKENKNSTATKQITLFKRLYDESVNSYNNLTWFSRITSWKNRTYDESVTYITDVARTVWILAICPIYLFFVGLVLFWILYHIRVNSKELRSISIPTKVMNILHKKRSLSSYFV